MRTPLLIGLFSLLGTGLAGQFFDPLGEGLNGPVYKIYADGEDIYVGGDFTDAGGVADADYLARWDGSSWHAVAPGLDGIVLSIARQGEALYVGGIFQSPFPHFAKWESDAWNSPGGVVNGPVRAIACDGQDVFVGGDFSSTGNIPGTAFLARWDGTAWQSMGAGLDDRVRVIKIFGHDVFVGGDFSGAEGVSGIHKILRWDGSSWHAVVNEFSDGDIVADLVVWGSDHIVAAGHFHRPAEPYPDNASPLMYVSGDSVEWTGVPYSYGNSLAVVDGQVLASIWDLWDFGDYVVRLISAPFGAVHFTLFPYPPGELAGVTLCAAGQNLYFGGEFQNAGGNNGDRIVRWSSPLTSIPGSSRNALSPLQVSPSPANNAVWLDFKGDEGANSSFAIYRLDGRVMLRGMYDGGPIDVSVLSPGVYSILVDHPNGRGTGRFVKQ